MTNDTHKLYKKIRRNSIHIITRKRIRFTRFWRTLTFAQRCYFIATSMLMIWYFFDMQTRVIEVVTFSFVLAGVIKEIWPRFMIVWHSLPGKAFILFIYAVLANFAIASASGIVNDVTGVSASSLPYSHNFAIILMLPGWLFITSILALVVATLLTPLYLVLLLALKPLGMRTFWHAPHYRFVLTTAFIRYIWTFALLVELFVIAAQLGLYGDLTDDRNVNLISFHYSSDDDESLSNFSTGQGASTPEQNSSNILLTENAEKAHSDDALDALIEDAKVKSIAFKRVQRRLLADFIFEFEADSYSRCSHKEGSRVVELNDYEILQIVKNNNGGDNNDYSYNEYTYEVVACQSAAIGMDVAVANGVDDIAIE